MQYLGGKSRIVTWLVDMIQAQFPKCKHFLDLFSGTSIVAFTASQRGFSVHTNDIQHYAWYIAYALLKASREGIQDAKSRLLAIKNNEILFAKGRSALYDLYASEYEFFENGVSPTNWSTYSEFCANTNLYDGNTEQAICWRKQQPWHLFATYYSNTYFGVRQCLELDAIRQISQEMDADTRAIVIAATISVMTFLVSSTTHLAQFLKPSNFTRTKALIERRKMSILDSVLVRLDALSQTQPVSKESEIMRHDFHDALQCFDISGDWIVYVDPPYFKEHYSRYYHVIETFALYDYPELDVVPKLYDELSPLVANPQ